MRALHLFFRLHRPYEIKTPENFDQGYFGGEAEFREAERTEYQPFFALIERNMQRHANLKISLAVSGTWLEQAEKWAPELTRRLRKLVETGRVEILAQPYYHSLAAFYDRTEFAEQVERFQKRAQVLLGAECRSLCLPELIYHDKIAKWAEERDFSAVLAGDADRVLDWRSANYVYEVPGCVKTRVLFQNTALSTAVRLGQRTVMVEGVKKVEEVEQVAEDKDAEASPSRSKMTAAEFVRGMSGVKRPAQTLRVSGKPLTRVESDGVWTFSAKKLQKQLEMACLRGNLVNLCLDSGIFQVYREQGVIAMFDELFASWLKVPGNRFVTASEAVEAQAPRAVVSVKTTVNWRGELAKKHEPGIVSAKEVRYCPPAWLRSEEQVRTQRELYGLRTAVLSSNDEKLIVDFGRMTALDYLLLFEVKLPKVVGERSSSLTVTTLADFQAALTDLRERTPILKLPEHGEAKEASESGSDLAKAGEGEKQLEQRDSGAAQVLPEEEDHSVVVHRVRREEAPIEVQEAEEPEEEYLDEDELEMDEWQEAVSDAADDAEAELQIMMQRMSRAKAQEGEVELEGLVEAEVVTPEEEPADEGKARKKKKVRKHLVIE